MITEVTMKRKLWDSEISQKSKSEFFSATDLVKAGNKWRVNNDLPLFNMSTWFSLVQTKEFVAELENKYGKVKINSKGKNDHTWVHPFLFLDIALAISPVLKIEVYEWLFDKLIEYRNDSGDSYRQMAGALWVNQSNKSQFPDYIKEVAIQIQKACEVSNWQQATEPQLKLRDKIHENISLLAEVLRDNVQAVRLGIIKTVKQIKLLK